MAALFAVAALGAVGMIAIAEADRLSASDALEDTSLSTQARDLIGGIRFDRAGRVARVTPPARWRRAYSSPGAGYYSLYDPNGRLSARSANLGTPLSSYHLRPDQTQSPLMVVGPDQDLVMAQRAPHGYLLVVGRSNPGALDEAHPAPFADFMPLLIYAAVLAFGVVLVWLLADWSLRPLRRASLEASQIGPETPMARLSLRGLPSEARPLAEAVNGALDRVALAYAAERRFTADAAHALRTPVAVMDLRLQRAAATGTMNLQALKSDVQEIAHMIAGLLNLAHAEHGPPPPSETVNLARLLREQAGAIEPLLAQSSRLITVEAPEALLIQADRRAVRDMVAALLDNAIQHGEGSITASLTSAKPLAVLQVYDEGAGVPPSDWEVVFDRFRKRDGASPGAGLGLAIVRQIAIRAGGEAKFIAPSCVQVKLPAYSEAR